MTKWEYKHDICVDGDFEKTANKLGESRWEIISINQELLSGAVWLDIFMKRKLNEDLEQDIKLVDEAFHGYSLEYESKAAWERIKGGL